MSVAFALPIEPEPSAEEREHLRTLVRGIVMAQGNIFIKELLREKRIKIGVAKTDFERHLLQAIDDGQLRLADVIAWLDEVEGWGDQHVYLYEIPATISRRSMWAHAEQVHARVSEAGLGHLWNAETSLAFPEEPALTGIFFDPATRDLRLVWHERSDNWVRVEELDRQEVIDGDLYEFRAFRQRPNRTVMRFVMRLQAGIAALFLSSHITDKEHEHAIKEAMTTSLRLFNLGDVWKRPVVMAKVIANLDQGQTKGSANSAAPESVQLASGGSYVEFASFSAHRSYLESEAVRNARLAIRQPQLRSFIGTKGVFKFPKTTGKGISRDVRVHLYGEKRKIRLWQRMTATDVWEILEILRRSQ